VAGNQFTARWGHRFPPRGLIVASGRGCFVTATCGAVALSIFGLSTAMLFIPTILLYFFAAVGIAPVQAEAVAAQPERAGAASGMMTALQMLVGALAVQTIGFAHDGTAWPLFFGLLTCSMAALAAFVRRTPNVHLAKEAA
jgi:hypothetical protein